MEEPACTTFALDPAKTQSPARYLDWLGLFM